MDATGENTPTERAALRLVNTYMAWSVSAGLIPVPLVDLATITAVQLKMIYSISKLYSVPFARDAAKSIVGALVGGGSSAALAVPAASALKVVPIVGQIAGALTKSALAAATTYALGKVFIQHYETGGNLLNFNAHDLRQYYNEQFASARKPSAAAS